MDYLRPSGVVHIIGLENCSMAIVSSRPKISSQFDNVIKRYRYLGTVLDGIFYQEAVSMAGHVLTLKYKNGTYEMFSAMNMEDIQPILERKNLELQPKRGGPASQYHV
jgi:hypothetical protein